MAPIGNSGAGGKRIREKSLKLKISCQTPFNIRSLRRSVVLLSVAWLVVEVEWKDTESGSYLPHPLTQWLNEGRLNFRENCTLAYVHCTLLIAYTLCSASASCLMLSLLQRRTQAFLHFQVGECVNCTLHLYWYIVSSIREETQLQKKGIPRHDICFVYWVLNHQSPDVKVLCLTYLFSPPYPNDAGIFFLLVKHRLNMVLDL